MEVYGEGFSHLYQRYWGEGVTPQRGGGRIFHTRAEKIGVFLHTFGADGAENVFFAAPKAPRKIFEHFFEIFGKFVNKNAIKSDFWGVVGRYISKKVLKIFSRRLRRRKCVEISPFFDPRSVDGTPPPRGVTPPPNISVLQMASLRGLSRLKLAHDENKFQTFWSEK